MEKFEFLEYLRDESISYEDKGNVIEVGNGDWDLEFSMQPFRYTPLFPKGIKIIFVNRGEVALNNIEFLTDGMEFRNEGGVSIYSQAGINFGESIKILCEGELYLSPCSELPSDIIISPMGGMDLEYLNELHKGIDLSESIEGNVKILAKEELVIPDGIEFKNKGDLFIKGCDISDNVIFNNKGKITIASINNIGNNIVFSNTGEIEIISNKITSKGMVFKNDSFVDLDRVESIKNPIEFLNNGDVSMDNLFDVDTNIPQKFKNDGGVYLRSLKEIPYGFEFLNSGSVITGISFEGIDRKIAEKRLLNLIIKRLS